MLEASDRVGGRTVNEQISETEKTEMGGQWVGPTQDRVLALIEELGLETFPTRTEGDNVIEVGGSLRRYRGTIPKLSPLVLADLALARFKLARAMRKVDPAAPWEAAKAADLDAQTLGDWIDRNTRTHGARSLLALSCKTVWGAEPETSRFCGRWPTWAQGEASRSSSTSRAARSRIGSWAARR